MAEEHESRRMAWQPFTLKGVASFAQAPVSRVLWVQSTVALMAAGFVLGFLLVAWEPVLDQAIRGLPDRSEIRNGELGWHGPDPTRLAENSFLSVIVALDETGVLGAASDIQIEFGRRECRFRSLLGSIAIPYPTGWVISANRQELEPRWEAWRPLLLAGLATGVVLGLFISWWILATVYSCPVRLIAFYADKEITLPGSWRLASASLLPGAILMSLSISAYGLQRLSLIQLILAAGLHLVIGWVYALTSPFRLPRHREVKQRRRKRNPFVEKPRKR